MRVLQDFLTRVGVRTSVDGHYGPVTARRVKTWERRSQRRINGRVSRADGRKLRRQVKEERKGAIRELRKDARFLAGVQQREQQGRDEGYAKRMRQVHGGLEGERAEEKSALREKEKDKQRKREGKKGKR